jgi:hypothetical protein
LAGACIAPHFSKATIALFASVIVSPHAAGSTPIDSHPPPLLTRANALRTFSRAAAGEPLSAISAAILNALPAGVTTQSGHGGFARAPITRRKVNTPATGQQYTHDFDKSIMNITGLVQGVIELPNNNHIYFELESIGNARLSSMLHIRV